MTRHRDRRVCYIFSDTCMIVFSIKNLYGGIAIKRDGYWLRIAARWIISKIRHTRLADIPGQPGSSWRNQDNKRVWPQDRIQENKTSRKKMKYKRKKRNEKIIIGRKILAKNILILLTESNINPSNQANKYNFSLIIDY